jgi:hypothetical protein
MKIDNLKHPFMIFGDSKIKMCFLDNLTKRKGSLFALTSNPYDFLNLFSKHLSFEHKQQKQLHNMSVAPNDKRTSLKSRHRIKSCYCVVAFLLSSYEFFLGETKLLVKL